LVIFRKRQQRQPKGNLVFRSNEAAFQMACKFGNNSLDDENLVVSIVLKGAGDEVCIKFANQKDDTIPYEEVDKLLSVGSVENICFSAQTLNGVPPLKKGDLVMSFVPRGLLFRGGSFLPSALIAAKISPEINKAGGWKVIR
jgi:hypothetical protein